MLRRELRRYIDREQKRLTFLQCTEFDGSFDVMAEEEKSRERIRIFGLLLMSTHSPE